MSENQNEPREYDAVRGGQNSALLIHPMNQLFA